MCVREGAEDDCSVPERHHQERAEEVILRMATRFHLGLSHAARPEVESKKIRRRAGAGMVAHLENASHDQIHNGSSLPNLGPLRGRRVRNCSGMAAVPADDLEALTD